MTDQAIRKAKPSDKPYKLSDSNGLFLLIKPDGARYWRMKYRYTGKETLLAFGVYPIVSLAGARERRDNARKQIANGIAPPCSEESCKSGTN